MGFIELLDGQKECRVNIALIERIVTKDGNILEFVSISGKIYTKKFTSIDELKEFYKIPMLNFILEKK